MGEARDRQAEGAGAPHRPGAGEIRGAGAGDARQDRQGADKRKAEQDAQRRVAKAKRELREDFSTTVLATQDDSRQDRIQPLRIEEGARVRLRDIREPAIVRRKLSNGRIEVEAGFMKMQVSEGRRHRGAARGRRLGQQAAAQRQLSSRAGAGARASGDQRHRPARRGSPRRRGRIPRSRRDGHRQPRPHRARPRHGRAQADDRRDAGAPPARR
jgi:hypothetical protein